MLTDTEYAEQSAAEIVVVVNEATRPEVGIVGENGDIALTTGDKQLARAIAARIVEISTLLPDPPRDLRRDQDADEFFRRLES